MPSCLADRNRRTDLKQGSLIATHAKPYRSASGDTMYRWLKAELSASGIRIVCYKAHICKAVSTSKGQISVRDILERACWSQESTPKSSYQLHFTKNFDSGSLLIGSTEY